MTEIPPSLEGEEKEAYEADRKARLAFIRQVEQRWHAYLSEKGGVFREIDGEIISDDRFMSTYATYDSLLHLAVNLIREVGTLEESGPVQEIKLGHFAFAKMGALSSIQFFSDFETLHESTFDELKKNETMPTEVRPIDLVLGEQVRRARLLGASWREIGERMGITSQGAQKKAREKGWVEDEGSLPESAE